MPSVVPSSKLPPARMLVPNELHGLGVVGGIPARTTNIIDLSAAPYNVGSSGNITSAMQAAADTIAYSGSEKVILIPAGSFTFTGVNLSTGAFTPKNDFTIRGAGMGLTTLNGGFNIGLGPDYSDATVDVTEATATADSTTVTVSSTAGITAGMMARFRFPDDYRIPVLRFDNVADYNRVQAVVITAINSGTSLSFTPPLPLDFSDIETLTGNKIKLDIEAVYNRASRVGIEDLTIDVNGLGFQKVFDLQGTENCWLKGVKFTGHTGHGMTIATSTNFEMRHCYIGGSPGAGAGLSGVLWENCTNLFFVDNIGLSNQPIFEGWSPSTNVVLAYNYIPTATNDLAINVHNGHNQFVYMEGNIVPTVQIDAYYANTSYIGLHRNWLTSRHGAPGESGAATVTFCTDIQRAARQVFFTGNLLRAPGVSNTDQGYFLGYPYTGYITNGTAEPSTGDWWLDYNTTTHKAKAWTGTLTTRTDNATGVITMDSSAQADELEASLAVSSDNTRSGSWCQQVFLGARSGDTFPLTFSNQTLPSVSSALTLYPGYSGFREIDLDVGNTTTKRVNYNYYDGAIPSGEAIGSDTLPESIIYDEKPDWFGSLAWPPIDPNSAPASYAVETVAIIPAAWRYLYDNEDYLNGTSQPSFSVTPGTYNSTQSVTITCSTSSSSIYYTTDGSTPDNTDTLYTAPVSIAVTTTLKAIAYVSGADPSFVRSGLYTIQAATPSFSPAAGTYGSAQSVTISCATSGASIYYTTDGSTPDNTDTLYTSSVSITSTTTLRAIAYKSPLDPSSVFSGAFTISSGGPTGLTVNGTLSAAVWAF